MPIAPDRRVLWRATLYALLITWVALIALLTRTVLVHARAPRKLSATTTPSRRIPHTDVVPYGANFFLAREVEPWKIEKTLDMAAEAGIVWVKQQFPWEDIEPRRKGEYLVPGTTRSSWEKYDHIVEACEAHNMRIVARLDRPPNWTRRDNTYAERPPDDLADYGDFVYAFVERYEGRISYIQIWNEPNIFPEWGNQAVDPAGYVELLRVAYRRAKEANPSIIVLDAPLAITLGQSHPHSGQWISMSDLQYLEKMYQAGAADCFDIHSANAFGMSHPPEDPPDAKVLNFQRVVLQREIMVKYGDRDKPVWFNEYGWNAAPEDFAAEHLVWGRVSEAQQAEYTLRGIQFAREQWPWAGAFMLWYFRQVGNVPPNRADYYFCLVDPDFTPRPIYWSIQDVASRAPIAGPGLHQETSPSVTTAGRWSTRLEPTASGDTIIVSEEPGASLTFVFSGSGVDLDVWRGPGAGRLRALIDGRLVSGLPTDEEGMSMIDLYAAALEPNASVTVAEHLSPGEHTLRLSVSEHANPLSRGIACSIDALRVHGSKEAAWPWARIAGLVMGLVINTTLIGKIWPRVRWLLAPGQRP